MSLLLRLRRGIVSYAVQVCDTNSRISAATSKGEAGTGSKTRCVGGVCMNVCLLRAEMRTYGCAETGEGFVQRSVNGRDIGVTRSTFAIG